MHSLMKQVGLDPYLQFQFGMVHASYISFCSLQICTLELSRIIQNRALQYLMAEFWRYAMLVL